MNYLNAWRILGAHTLSLTALDQAGVAALNFRYRRLIRRSAHWSIQFQVEEIYVIRNAIAAHLKTLFASSCKSCHGWIEPHESYSLKLQLCDVCIEHSEQSMRENEDYCHAAGLCPVTHVPLDD